MESNFKCEYIKGNCKRNQIQNGSLKIVMSIRWETGVNLSSSDGKKASSVNQTGGLSHTGTLLVWPLALQGTPHSSSGSPCPLFLHGDPSHSMSIPSTLCVGSLPHSPSGGPLDPCCVCGCMWGGLFHTHNAIYHPHMSDSQIPACSWPP